MTTTNLLLREATRTGTAAVGLLCALLLGGGGGWGLTLALEADEGPSAAVGAAALLVAGWISLTGYLLRGQMRVRVILHAAGVPLRRILFMEAGRLLTFTLPGAVVGAAAASTLGVMPLNLVAFAVAGAGAPLVVVLFATAAAWIAPVGEGGP